MASVILKAPFWPWLYRASRLVAMEPPNRLAALERLAHDIFYREIGNGEPNADSNNWGPDVIRYRRGDGTGRSWKGRGAWCAVMRSYTFMAAASELGLRVPFGTSRGAKRITQRVGDAGRFIVAPGPGGRVGPDELLALLRKTPRGATIGIHRTKDAGDRRGHVMSFDHLVVDITNPTRSKVVYIEGNKNNRGIRPKRYAVVDHGARSVAALSEKLYAISTLQPVGA